jgi:hypothetical protein
MFMSTRRNRSATGDDGEDRRARRRLRGPRGWAVLATVAVAASSAAGMMVLEAGTVLAPEPVVTTQPLTGTNGETGDAVSLNTPPPPGYWVWPDGSVRPYIRWPSEFVYAPWLAAGTPCSPVMLPVDAVATYHIIAVGNYRSCD